MSVKESNYASERSIVGGSQSKTADDAINLDCSRCFSRPSLSRIHSTERELKKEVYSASHGLVYSMPVIFGSSTIAFMLCYTTPTASPPPGAHRLERVVLGRNLLDEVVAEDGHLLHDVLAYAGNLSEEEEREETGNATEACSETAAVLFVSTDS